MKGIKSWSMIGVLAVFALIVVFSSVVTIDAGHVGVVKRLGAVQDEYLPEGLHMKVPFIDTVIEIDVRLRRVESQASAASRDLQVVVTTVTLQYSMNGALMPKVYQGIGDREVVVAAILSPAIQESVKAVTAQYTAEELVTKRAEAKIKIQEVVEEFVDSTVSQKDVSGSLSIQNLAITDFEFTDEFNKAIEEKVKAEQDALKAENEKLKRITQAEAAAAEKELQADAEAYLIEVESQARAEAIRRESEALAGNPDLIQLRLAEKWDGQLPQITSGTVPFLNLSQQSLER